MTIPTYRRSLARYDTDQVPLAAGLAFLFQDAAQFVPAVERFLN